MSDRRYLLGVLVYNGREVVPRCLDSAALLVRDGVDVMVFDDCSPSPGWSAEVEQMCAARSIGYYRTPRNLGIPRNMSLVLRTAEFARYDVVGLLNSDIVLPPNLIAATDAVLDSHADVASITPWSNNVSAFSLPLREAGDAVAEQGLVTALSDALADIHGAQVIDIPTGVGYCMLMPVDAVRRIGVMDTIFGRGYCEEVDWCQRAVQAGLRHVLALGAFVYHEGSGTNRDEGLLAHGQTTVWEHEKIVRHRYPDYMPRVEQFLATANLTEQGTSSLGRAIALIAADRGYDLLLGHAPAPSDGRPALRITAAAGASSAAWNLLGATVPFPGAGPWTPEILERTVGRPRAIRATDGRLVAPFEHWLQALGISSDLRSSYPLDV